MSFADLGGGVLTTAAPTSSTKGSGAEFRLVGRDRHLNQLAEAFESLRQRKAVCVRVAGPSGSGKTALARAFLERIFPEGAVVLAGRCYEQELVPYKAFDGVVDALGRYLAALAEAEAASVLPRDANLLARLFPVLGGVPAFRNAPRVGANVVDQREVRRAGSGRCGSCSPGSGTAGRSWFIDDLQWGDADSALILEELLRRRTRRPCSCSSRTGARTPRGTPSSGGSGRSRRWRGARR